MAEANAMTKSSGKDDEEEKKLGRKGKQEEPAKSKEAERAKTVPFLKLFSFADSTDKLLMILGTAGAVGNGISLPLTTVILGSVIDAFGENSIEQVVHVISQLSIRFLYLGIGSAIAAFLQVTCWMITGERQAARMRSIYLRAILRQDISFFDTETSTGEVVGRMSGDTVLIQDATGEKVGKCIQLFTTFLGGFIISFSEGWLLTLVLLSALPFLVLVGCAMFMLVFRMVNNSQKAYAEAASLVEQTIGSIRTVASFTGEKRAISEYNKHLITAYKSGVGEGLAQGIGVGLFMSTLFGTYGLAVWYGSKVILHKGYTAGQVISVIIVLLASSLSLGQASTCLSAFAAGKVAAYKMFETINRKPVIDSYDVSGKTANDIRGDIEFKDVYFSYPARPDEQIFTGFSLSIPSGTTAALVGHSGSGKSTVISLIQRFYDPQAGQVLIDGMNLKELQLKWIRGKIGLVSQEPVLFSSSIKDNIAYGKDGATIEEIRAAAEFANATKFIDNLPQGFDTMVGERGAQISGGQKQRIAIARAILKDPRILLLDEATSALDAESERVVQEAIDSITGNRTTVIVAHRLTTVRNADMIAVIHQGKVIENGTHLELVEDPEGAYSKLIRLQEVHKEEEEDEANKLGTINEFHRQPSRTKSLARSKSRQSRNSSCDSLSFSISIPAGLEVLESTMDGTGDLPPKGTAPPVPIHRLAYLHKPEIPVLLIGTIVASLNGSILPLYGMLISKAIKAFFETPHKLKKDSEFWALMFMTLGIAACVLSLLRTYLFSIAGCKLIQRIRSMCFETVVSMEIGWFDEPENTSGAIGARLYSDASKIRALAGDNLANFVQNTATAIAAMLIAFIASWQLTLIVLAMLPTFIASGISQRIFMRGFSADAKVVYGEASQVANEAVGSIRTVASCCAEEKVIQLYERKYEEPTETGARLGVISGTGFGLSSFFLNSFYAVAFYAGARLVKSRTITLTDVFQVFFSITMATSGITASSSVLSDIAKAKEAVASIFSIIDRKSKIDPSDESGITLESVKGDIELQHISFRYPSRPDVQIFRDISLTIRSGKTVALVGESGSGKSTVIALLLRFYDPEYGRITLDGTEIQKFQIRWLRKHMGLVGQEPVLFNGTIRANIAYGKEGDATEAEIIAAAELANAHTFISGLQQGYDTEVGERGVQLSGGQKQRVAISRAIIKDPKILLLDEATSALDAESERVVQDALDRVMVQRTTVVVAHRLSTIKNADVIAVVNNGTIVEKGKHEKLINIEGGFYASLVALHMRAQTT